ncbi:MULTISPECIES: hypothetical protein [unclassified Legionella]|uniref:hypothetical protein n=1 Tax=unclassified Legionella TaxID=2622702 RepID=UPI00105475B8|nr:MULTISPECIES: hypothetical protein [unclassified Legionella]MDI9818472.1 hypothetical protein [Legionella sp. PL877]
MKRKYAQLQIASEELTSSKPDASTSSKPDASTSSKPENSTSSKPENSTSSKLAELKRRFIEVHKLKTINLPCVEKHLALAITEEALAEYGTHFLARIEITTKKENKRHKATIIGVAEFGEEKELFFILDHTLQINYCSQIRSKKTFKSVAERPNPLAVDDYVHPVLEDYARKLDSQQQEKANKDPSKIKAWLNHFLHKPSRSMAQEENKDLITYKQQMN